MIIWKANYRLRCFAAAGTSWWSRGSATDRPAFPTVCWSRSRWWWSWWWWWYHVSKKPSQSKLYLLEMNRDPACKWSDRDSWERAHIRRWRDSRQVRRRWLRQHLDLPVLQSAGRAGDEDAGDDDGQDRAGLPQVWFQLLWQDLVNISTASGPSSFSTLMSRGSKRFQGNICRHLFCLLILTYHHLTSTKYPLCLCFYVSSPL